MYESSPARVLNLELSREYQEAEGSSVYTMFRGPLDEKDQNGEDEETRTRSGEEG